MFTIQNTHHNNKTNEKMVINNENVKFCNNNENSKENCTMCDKNAEKSKYSQPMVAPYSTQATQ